MCDPVTIMTSMAVASTAASLVTQARSAKMQEAAIAETLTRTEEDVTRVASNEANERLREARREQSRVRAAAGEAGLQIGGSVLALLQDSAFQAANYNEGVRTNRDSRLKAARAEANSMYSRVEKPTALGGLLQLANAGLQGYSAGKSLQVARQTGQTRTTGA